LSILPSRSSHTGVGSCATTNNGRPIEIVRTHADELFASVDKPDHLLPTPRVHARMGMPGLCSQQAHSLGRPAREPWREVTAAPAHFHPALDHGNPGHAAMTQHLRPEALQQLKSGFAAWEKLYAKRWRWWAISQNVEDSFWLLFLFAFLGTVTYWIASNVLEWLTAYCLSL
jgi:hypothetical protein